MAGQTILIADDDQGLQHLLGIILNRAGYQVVTATNGEDAVERVRALRPDLVLMDVSMPIMDGIRATRHIRRLPEGRTLPIIFLTAVESSESTINALRSGGDDYIIKPVRAGELLARIEAHLRPAAPSPGKLITMYGSRPGVGATTLAIHLALAMRQASQKEIVMIDWQRARGDVALMLGLGEASPLDGLLPQVSVLDDATFMAALREVAPGVWLLPGSPDAETAQHMDRKSATYVSDFAVTKAGYAVVDAGAFFNWSEPLLAAKDDGLNLCVMTRDPVAVARAARLMAVLDGESHRVWPILNRCRPGDDERAAIESQIGREIAACIPDLGDTLADAVRDGRFAAAPDSNPGYGRALSELAQRIVSAFSPVP